MSRVPFCFVDVFARRPLTGNPLSLVPDADDLTGAQMAAIAREFNQSMDQSAPRFGDEGDPVPAGQRRPVR